MSKHALQFQTAHGRRAFWVLCAWAPVLPGVLWLGGSLAGDAPVSLVFYALVFGVEALCLLWWAARRPQLGLFVGPGEVRSGPIVPGSPTVEFDPRNPPHLEIALDRKIARVWLIDSAGNREKVTSMLLVRNGFPGHRTLGGPNHLLVRERADRVPGAWRSTGLIWDEDNADEMLEYLRAQAGHAVALGEQPA